MAGVGLILVGLWGAVSADDEFQPPRVVQPQTSSPLERLKNRSADERLQNLKNQWRPHGRNSAAPASEPQFPPVESIDLPEDSESVRTEPSVPVFVNIPEVPSNSQAPYEEIAPEEGVTGSSESAPSLPPVPSPFPQRREAPVSRVSALQEDLPPQSDEVPPPQTDDILPPRPDPVRTADDLKRVTEILPFQDYRPQDRYDEAVGEINLYPEEVPLTDGDYTDRFFPHSIFAWEASNLCYNPLYFQDIQLERYGHTHHPLIQPAVSIGLFSAQFLGLPYQMTINPPCKAIYPLGYYRPGECAPCLYYQVPLNAKAALVTAGVYTGLFYLIP